MNNNTVESGCETLLTKKQWQTPEVIVLSSDDTEFLPGFGMDAGMVDPGSASS